MTEYPDSIPLMVTWSFANPGSHDVEEFIAKLKDYNKEVTSDMGLFNPHRILNFFGRTMLSNDTKLERLRIKYQYSVQTESGDWEDLEKVLDIESSTGTLSIGELVYWIHHGAKQDLADQDHCYLEEIYLSEDSQKDSFPTYELFLGS